MPDAATKQDTRAGLTRRSFLHNLWLVVGLIALIELIGGAFAFVVSGRRRQQSESGAGLIEAGLIDDFEPGSVTLLAAGHLYLVRLQDGGFLALSRQCTHLSCAVAWHEDQQQFVCPCHASLFSLTGEVLKSPAPRALDLHPVLLENNTVKVDIGQRKRRSVFKDDQPVYPQERG